jgi:hypothetical protein
VCLSVLASQRSGTTTLIWRCVTAQALRATLPPLRPAAPAPAPAVRRARAAAASSKANVWQPPAGFRRGAAPRSRALPAAVPQRRRDRLVRHVLSLCGVGPRSRRRRGGPRAFLVLVAPLGASGTDAWQSPQAVPVPASLEPPLLCALRGGAFRMPIGSGGTDPAPSS